MNALLDRAIAAVSNLPEAEQETIAREIFEWLDANARWEKLLDDPRSEQALSRLASEARREIANGDVLDFDPASRPD